MEKTRKLSEDARILDDYLKQYRRCINHKHDLERRCEEIEKEFDAPLRAPVFDGMPKGSAENLGAAALPLQKAEIQTRIEETIRECQKQYVNINMMISFLPKNSQERFILEKKYIDGKSWSDICRTESITKTPAVQRWRNGLNILLEYDRTKIIVKEHRETIREKKQWIA